MYQHEGVYENNFPILRKKHFGVYVFFVSDLGLKQIMAPSDVESIMEGIVLME